MADADVQIAILQTKVEALTNEVTELKTAVKDLTDVMNRGKGAFAASLALAGAIGAGVMKLVLYLFSLGHPGQ
jgi:hypothetical protein